jgi:hypothetical protein
MKKLLLIVLMSIRVLTAHSQVMIATHYDAETTSKQIIRGRIKNYLADDVEYVVEKKTGRYIILNFTNNPDDVQNRLQKVFDKGKVEYTSRTNGGHIIKLSVISLKNELDVINYCIFHVDVFKQKIVKIEILKGDE